MPVAAAAAVAAAKTGRRVRYSLSRNDDMRINGGRQASCFSIWQPPLCFHAEASLPPSQHVHRAWESGVMFLSGRRVCAGRSETMVEYDVGLKSSGEITAIKIRGYFLCGAFLDLGFNDMMVLQQGVDQVHYSSAIQTRHP